LAATVRPPIGQSLSDGPFPTVIEYSGYQIAAPNEPLIAKVGSLLGLPSDPLAPGGETDVGSLLVRLAGFAVVSVQMRGTGCSGGESDLFDLPTRLDGYDAVETVAAQPWVKGGTVGMVGISFSGFSQVATAATHPPHLSAVAPMSFVGSSSMRSDARPTSASTNASPLPVTSSSSASTRRPGALTTRWTRSTSGLRSMCQSSRCA
jgi:putative CocE/NonD family hydrolase